MHHVIQPRVFDGSEQRQQLKSTRQTVNNYNSMGMKHYYYYRMQCTVRNKRTFGNIFFLPYKLHNM